MEGGELNAQDGSVDAAVDDDHAFVGADEVLAADPEVRADDRGDRKHHDAGNQQPGAAATARAASRWWSGHPPVRRACRDRLVLVGGHVFGARRNVLRDRRERDPWHLLRHSDRGDGADRARRVGVELGADIRRPAADAGVHHVRDDDCDVVRAATDQRQLDQRVRRHPGIRVCESLGDGLGGHHAGQPVGADQIAVASGDLPDGQGRVDLGAVQRAQQQRALWVVGRFLLGDPAVIDERLHEGVVMGQLVQDATPVEVGAGVADMRHPEPAAVKEQGRQSGAHAVEFGVLVHNVGDRAVAVAGGLCQGAQQVSAGVPLVQRHEGGYHQPGCHVTGRVPAHSVGDYQQGVAGVDRVLVAGPDQSAIAARRVGQLMRHGRSSMTVRPMRIGTPMGTGVGVVTRARSR